LVELTGPRFVREVRQPMSTARMLAAVLRQAASKRQGSIRESPEMHFTPLIAEAAVSAQFPLSPLGLIHMGQRVELLEPLHDAEPALASTRSVR
jgi:hypothetical protein